jgi:hypothetical protein
MRRCWCARQPHNRSNTECNEAYSCWRPQNGKLRGRHRAPAECQAEELIPERAYNDACRQRADHDRTMGLTRALLTPEFLS